MTDSYSAKKVLRRARELLPQHVLLYIFIFRIVKSDIKYSVLQLHYAMKTISKQYIV